ncbi:hypothetical protein C8R43DRAFT_1164612 [Mycena crocata]|nr:hypothetical protein C8R43DRAFT_1164612 [Mycena crocata]
MCKDGQDIWWVWVVYPPGTSPPLKCSLPSVYEDILWHRSHQKKAETAFRLKVAVAFHNVQLMEEGAEIYIMGEMDNIEIQGNLLDVLCQCAVHVLYQNVTLMQDELVVFYSPCGQLMYHCVPGPRSRTVSTFVYEVVLGVEVLLPHSLRAKRVDVPKFGYEVVRRVVTRVLGPGKLHQRVVRKFGFLRAKNRDFLVRKLGF